MVEVVVTETERVPVDMVLLGTGVRPRTALVEDAGRELGPTGAIATDAYPETSVPDVYAAAGRDSRIRSREPSQSRAIGASASATGTAKANRVSGLTDVRDRLRTL